MIIDYWNELFKSLSLESIKPEGDYETNMKYKVTVKPALNGLKAVVG